MIYPDDSKAFSTLMDVTWQSLGRNHVDRQTKQYWFGKLQKYALGVVTESFDKWLTNSDELPAIKDIIKGCIPKEDFYKAVGYIPDAEIRKEGVREVNNFVAKNTKPKTDHHAWFTRILRNPKNFPTNSVSEARRVAREFGYDLNTLEANP